MFVIVIVAFIVIRPERLPEITEKLGQCLGRIRAWYYHLLQKFNSI